MFKKLLFLVIIIYSSSLYAAGLHVKTKVDWVGQFDSGTGFYFGAEHKDQKCQVSREFGHYFVDGVNAKGIYSMLLAAVSSGKYVSFNIYPDCANSGKHARVIEMYYHSR